MADQNAPQDPAPTPQTPSKTALTPKARKKSIQIKTPATPAPAAESSKSAIDAVTPSFSRNLHKLITSNKRHKLEVVSLKSQVEKLQEENLVLDRETSHLRTRVSSLEQERTDLHSLNRENERARRRAEARLSSLSARSASPHPPRPTHEPRRALAPLNARVADGVYGGSADPEFPIDTRPSCSGAPGPSFHTLASPSHNKPIRTAQAGFSLPSRSYHPPAQPSSSESAGASPRSHLADLPTLTSASSSSVNSPLHTPGQTTSELAFAAAFDKAHAKSGSSSSARGRLSALFGIPLPKKTRPSLDLGFGSSSMRGRENDDSLAGLARKSSTRSAKVMMVTSIMPDHDPRHLVQGPSSYPSATITTSATHKDTSASAAARAPSPYSAVSHSSASSARKVTPISTVSKASAGRVAFVGERVERDRDRERGADRERERERERVARRHISRPMDASNSSASSHHSHAQAHGARVSTDGTGRLSVDTAGAQRRSQISTRGRVSHGTFSFEKPAVAPPFGSSLKPQQQAFRPGMGISAQSVSVSPGSDARFGSTRSRGRMSLDERRPRADSIETNEKAGVAGLLRATSLRSARSVQVGGAHAGRAEKGAKEKTSCSSLGRLWLQKTKEVLCAARPASQASTIMMPPPPPPPTQEPSSAPANVTSFGQRRRMPVTTQLPAFAFEPAVRAATPESARSRATASSRGEREREVVFKVPEVPARVKLRRDQSDSKGSNTYSAFCAELRRVVGDDAFVVFEKYVRQYEAQVFPLLGPRGLVERLKKILDLSHAGEERKRALVDRFLALARDAEAR
ncbi:hypothetical protein AURDEDRAFT_183402 [Auricularia subglabra TFB-10046 SS5]|nr:hypothetical protein AURDEDRAFT_183402 [Auricularia subglabra TFB-10046 SS5]